MDMSDLIDRDALKEAVGKVYACDWDDIEKNFHFAEAVNILPSAEPEERTAKVEKVDTNSPHSQVYKCCKCGQYTHRTAWSRDVVYCPSCGAKLDWSGNERN